MARVDRETLLHTFQRAFWRLGPDEALALAEELAEATLAGHEPHGLGRVEGYLDALDAGTLRPGVRVEVVRQTAATALLDGGQGVGFSVASQAAAFASEMALRSGTAAVALRGCGDVARLAPYARQIAARGLVGMVLANDAGGGLVVAPPQGVEPRLSTNPIALGLPRPGGRATVFDMATSQLAIGAVKAAARRGNPVPGDVLVDSEGAEILDPRGAFSALLPLGGRLFGHKGLGLSLFADVCAGGLSGEGTSGEDPEKDGVNALFLQVVDPAAFGDPEVFLARVERLLDWVLTSRPRAGGRVRLPDPGDLPREVEVDDTLWTAVVGRSTRMPGTPLAG